MSCTTCRKQEVPVQIAEDHIGQMYFSWLYKYKCVVRKWSPYSGSKESQYKHKLFNNLHYRTSIQALLQGDRRSQIAETTTGVTWLWTLNGFAWFLSLLLCVHQCFWLLRAKEKDGDHQLSTSVSWWVWFTAPNRLKTYQLLKSLLNMYWACQCFNWWPKDKILFHCQWPVLSWLFFQPLLAWK